MQVARLTVYGCAALACSLLIACAKNTPKNGPPSPTPLTATPIIFQTASSTADVVAPYYAQTAAPAMQASPAAAPTTQASPAAAPSAPAETTTTLPSRNAVVVPAVPSVPAVPTPHMLP